MCLDSDYQINDKKINSLNCENPNKKYINSINNNIINKETNNTTDEKKKKPLLIKKLKEKYSITTKLTKNFFNKFLINDLNYKLKNNSSKKYSKFKKISLKKLNQNNLKYLFNSTIENILKKYDILQNYGCKSEHNLNLIKNILKNNDTNIKNILSLKVKHYFKNYYMSKEEKNIKSMNNKEKVSIKNFERFLDEITQKYQNKLDKKTIDEYIQKIREVAFKIIKDDENEDKQDIQIDENPNTDNINSFRPEDNIQNSFLNNSFENPLYYSNHNFDEHFFIDDNSYENGFFS
jgi:hypothetical protein